MRTRTALAAATLCLIVLGGCSSKNIIEEKTRNVSALRTTGSYYVMPLEVTFKPPQAWEISEAEWKDWVDTWKIDFREEMRNECYKTLEFPESAEGLDGAVVRCEIYEMDKGGFSGFGGNGFARAHITIVDLDGKTIYDAKLEGTGANSGFESTVVRGRMKFAVLNLARQISDVMEDGE